MNAIIPKLPKHVLVVRLEPTMHAEFLAICKREEVAPSTILRRAARAFMETHPLPETPLRIARGPRRRGGRSA